MPDARAIELPTIGPLGPETEEEWREHDARVQEARAAESRARETERRARRLQRLRELGAPERLLCALPHAHADTDAMRALAEMSEDRVVVLAGAVGIGKTLAALSWLMRAQGKPWFSTAARYARSSRYTEQSWERARVAVLDDLGVEYLDSKGSFCTDLDELVAHFHGQCKGLVITTNLTADAFKARYGARVTSRIREAGRFIPLRGCDRRTEGAK